MRNLLRTSLAFLLHFLSAFDGLLASFAHLLDMLMLFMLICLGWLGFSNLLACLTLLCKVGLLVLLRKLFPGRNLFHFFRGYHACVILALLNCCICILLFSFFENGVALGLRCCIFGVVFFVNFMDHRRFVPNKRSFQLLCLLQHSFSLGDFKW